jgi:RNA polymerase sigma-70 factor (ECF subfamily)
VQLVPKIGSPIYNYQSNSFGKNTFAELYHSYSPAIYSAINKVVKNTTLSQDVLQNTFIKIWQHQANFDKSKGTPFTWMLNIARNEAIDTLRSKRYRQSKVTAPLNEASFLNSDPFSHLDHMDVRKLLYILKPRDRVILELCFFRGYTCEQTAELLRLPCGTVKTRMQQSYKVLKAALTESPITNAI